jgi:hypothetical protein
MEAQPCEGLRVAAKKFRRLAAYDAVKRSYPLLAVEQEFHHARRQWPIAVVCCRF